MKKTKHKSVSNAHSSFQSKCLKTKWLRRSAFYFIERRLKILTGLANLTEKITNTNPTDIASLSSGSQTIQLSYKIRKKAFLHIRHKFALEQRSWRYTALSLIRWKLEAEVTEKFVLWRWFLDFWMKYTKFQKKFQTELRSADADWFLGWKNLSISAHLDASFTAFWNLLNTTKSKFVV